MMARRAGSQRALTALALIVSLSATTATAKHRLWNAQINATSAEGIDAPGTVGNSVNSSAEDDPSADRNAPIFVFGILCIIGAIVGFSLLVQKGRNADEADQAKKSELLAAGQQALARYMAEESKEYPFADVFDNDRAIMMDAKGITIRFINYDLTNGHAYILGDAKIPVSMIREVELVRHERTVVHHSSISQRKGVIGRAVVGELIGGDMGAVAGAMSAPTKTAGTSIEQKIFEFSELVFSMRDLAKPVLRFQTYDERVLDTWLYRIRSAMAGAGRSQIASPPI